MGIPRISDIEKKAFVVLLKMFAGSFLLILFLKVLFG
ncbi:MAG: hypothetical protein UR34_C0005G0008 [candidate division WS6 bacterium GW2011_GWC1_33_20]|uniref:Uncharacterized protein n=1 Tax=candidate division WS6 bacterium GW2011_GWC1_33_20 TaxID=1619089 RepID=A0A0G0BZ62_9BACT|nr:MAG: hypothetical protein UR32_C0002G0020 [candidate division WS6 bacterium GW2011_GWE2_33_157]KKP44185.1 MAG: hypothetical protein UR34_C0005G0008 [candidate division WS6 bacterium GW2011_GWC1_33_20]